MTRAEIIKMARDANLGEVTVGVWSEYLERFAALIAAAERNRTWTQDHWTEYERSIASVERERCISILERLHERSGGQYNYYQYAAKVLRGEA